MKRPIRVLGAGLLAGLIALATPTLARADDLFITLTSGSAQTQGMALILGMEAIRNGSKVRLLLCDTAGDLALKEGSAKEGSAPALAPAGKTPRQMLDGLIDFGATVEVCGLYLPNSGHAAADLRPGVAPVKPATIGAFMARPGVRYFTF
ncbi:hypothetical protein [Roseospirillum parvum]|uniref:DsrE/DsrF-like family protein n=1 Tax=Roseospirillum parvum TaxID=83401 RepID=A0A1G7WW88_9PROT|nr:hypothetical protein [Roseospirillum parvum]SDG76156.1 hypothetical protein SAMN05421742_102340 [Roseospirillum parvum]